MLVYLDNCCYNRPFDEQKQRKIIEETNAKLVVQELILDRRIDFVSSYVLTYEVDRMSNPIRKAVIHRFLNRAFLYIDQTYAAQIESLAKPIMERGIHTYDAFHIACALFANCDCFLTTDNRVLKFVDQRILVQNPIDFLTHWKEGAFAKRGREKC